MKLPPFFTTVTSFSKILAAVLFVTLPFAGFYLGMQYQKGIAIIPSPQVPIEKIPSLTINPTVYIEGTRSADWIIYNNTEAGFSLSYPPNALEESREPDPFPVARQFQFSEPRKRGGGGPSLSTGWLIIVSETQANPRNLRLREWGKEKQMIDPTYITVIDTSLGGLPAISWKNAGGDGNITNYLVKRADGITLVVTNVGIEVNYQYTVNKVLSTLRFTNDDIGDECNIDSDCGFDTCHSCKVYPLSQIKEIDRTCKILCAGRPKCIDNKCIREMDRDN